MVQSAAGPKHFGARPVERMHWPGLMVTGPKGLCAQRNRTLEVLQRNDILMLMLMLMLIDDDFLMAPDYLEQVMRLCAASPDVVMATGKVLTDGICGPGFAFVQGRARLSTARGAMLRPWRKRPTMATAAT